VAVTKAQAIKVVEAIKAHFKEVYLFEGEFTLFDYTHEDQLKGSWSIGSEGFDSWSMIASEEVEIDGIFLEPISHYSLGVYTA
jgi:hypothetical protein